MFLPLVFSLIGSLSAFFILPLSAHPFFPLLFLKPQPSLQLQLALVVQQSSHIILIISRTRSHLTPFLIVFPTIPYSPPYRQTEAAIALCCNMLRNDKKEGLEWKCSVIFSREIGSFRRHFILHCSQRAFFWLQKKLKKTCTAG